MTHTIGRPAVIPVEDLFGSPSRVSATISPDGTRIAYLAPWEGRLNVWVQSLTGDDDPRRVTADDNRSVFIYSWTDDPRWLLYAQDGDGDENWHVYRVDLQDPDAPAVDLTPFPGAKAILAGSRGPAGKVVVHLNTRRVDRFDLYEIDLATGEPTMIGENPGGVVSWLCSRRGDVFAMGLTPEGDVEVSRWDPVARRLNRIVVFDGTDYPMGIHPMELTPDGTGMWVGSSTGTDRTRLVRVDLATGEETDVDSHPTLSLDTHYAGPPPLIRGRLDDELLGVRYLGQRQVIHALEPHFAAVLPRLQALSDGDLGAVSCDENGQRWVVSFTHDREPAMTYLYDHATGESRLLFRPFEHLDPRDLARKAPVTITARDGLELPSYLTLPVGVEPHRLPLVLLVHGGPWARDRWGFEPDVQFLANRGYAVLQVNFRGSTGYGKAFMKAAIGEFAGKMHDDLIDAVGWAVDEGYADPDRIGIFGGSYGGYAALVGVTFTPDVFAAAVDYVGISSLVDFMRTLPPSTRPHLATNWHLYVGNPDIPEQEADMLARSPITLVDRIRTPLLVVQGANDARVVQAESDNLVAALRARGVEVEYLVKQDEGHGFLNEENVIELYRTVERFLAEHLGGRRA